MEFIFVLSFLAVIALWVLILIGLVSPKKFQNFRKGKPITRTWVLLFGVIGTIVLSIIIAITAPDPSNTTVSENKTTKEEKQPVNIQISLIDQVKAYDPKAIIAVEKQGDNVLDIQLKSSALGFSDSGYLDAAGREAKDILIQLKKNNSNEKFKIIRFIENADLKDQYNNKSVSAIFQIEYDFDEIKKFNTDGYIDYKMFLNFAKFQARHPVGQSVLEDWCQDGDNKAKSGMFCTNK